MTMLSNLNFLKITAILMALGSVLPSFAGQLSVNYGVGVGGQFGIGTKTASVSYSEKLLHPIHHKVEVGAWSDTSNGNISSMTFYSVGTKVRTGYFYVENYWGLGFISHPDHNLSTNFQFSGDFGIGIRDPVSKTGIGLKWKHISNAGIKQPNRGRDFLMIQLRFGVD